MYTLKALMYVKHCHCLGQSALRQIFVLRDKWTFFLRAGLGTWPTPSTIPLSFTLQFIRLQENVICNVLEVLVYWIYSTRAQGSKLVVIRMPMLLQHFIIRSTRRAGRTQAAIKPCRNKGPPSSKCRSQPRGGMSGLNCCPLPSQLSTQSPPCQLTNLLKEPTE